MARFTIYSKDGNSIRYVGEPQYSGSYMNVDFLEFRTISSPVPIEWQIGDYVDYQRTGLRYKLYSLPQPKKVARRGEYGAAFEYSNVQFFAATKELEIAPFRDLVPEDNNIHFSTRPDVSTFEDVYGIARRIQECMDDLYPNRWRIEVYDTDDADLLALFGETKEYSVSGGSCLDALSQIYEVWKNVGWIHTYDSATDTDIITIGRANVRDEENTSDAFAYGMGNGLTSIKKASANEGEFATRLYVYGSERNIQTRYYNEKDILNKDSVDIRNLMLPIEKWGKTNGLPDARKAYLQADDAIVEKYGLIPRTIYFDGGQNEEIYPSITGITEGKVRAEMIALGNGNSPLLPPDTNERLDKVVGCSHPYDKGNKEDMEAYPTFLLATRQLGFNLYEQGKLTEGGSAVISMKSGDCAGREFVVKSFDGSFRYPNVVLERSWDDSLGMGFPNGIYQILPDDEFVILEIPMPEFYISLAEERLLAAGQKMLADYTRVSAFYEPGIDAIEIHEGAKVLRAGMYMQVYDKDIIDTESNTDYVLIDSITIDEKSELPTYRVTLREQKRAARNFSALEDMIEDAKESAKNETDRARQYTDRRFRSAQETLSMLEGAFKNFSEGVNPVTVRTMALLVGDESLQFKFTASAESLDDIPCPLTWDNATKQMKATEAVLIHMTLGVDEVTAKGAREAEDYKHWTIPAQDLDVIDDTKARYVYARVPMDGTTATDAYVLSETYIAIDEEEGFYHLLVGILNSEYNGSRDFVTLYGFTEVLPGQITTDVIRSADGSCYFDLANNEIGGKIKFLAGSEGLENIGLDLNIGGQNMLRNSGFTGDYLSETLADDAVLDATKELFSDPLDHWTTSGTVRVVSLSGKAVSGKGISIGLNGQITQELYYPTIAEEEYVLSFKAKYTGASETSSIVVAVGGISERVSVAKEWEGYVVKVKATESSNVFSISKTTVGSIEICDLQLERGTMPTAWGNSPFDNSSDRLYYQSLKYIEQALADASLVGGGLILTNLLRLGSHSNQSAFIEKAGASGVYVDDNSPAFWAGGTMEQAIALIDAFKEDPSKTLTDEEAALLAKFALTHGGRAILNDGIFRGAIHATSGYFGDFVIDGLFAKSSHTDSHGCKWGDGLYQSWYGDGESIMQAYGYTDVEDSLSSTVWHGFKTNVGYFSDPGKTNNKFSFYANSGMIAGMRPTLRVIESQGSETSPNILYNEDHTIIATAYLNSYYKVPANPEDGCELEIISIYGSDITLLGGSFYDLQLGMVKNQWSAENADSRAKVKLVFSASLGMWIITEYQKWN